MYRSAQYLYTSKLASDTSTIYNGGIISSTLAGRLHIIVWFDSGLGSQLAKLQFDQVLEFWLLQDWLGTSVRKVNSVTLDLPVTIDICLL